MKLYYSNGSCSLAPHIVLNELGLSFEMEKVNLRDKTCSQGDFTKINPKGYVPCLGLDNGDKLTEVSVIIQYLADLKPQAGLMPKFDTFERYKTQEWINYIGTEIHKTYGMMFNAGSWVKNSEGLEQLKKSTHDALIKKFQFLSHHLETRNYLCGQNFSVADAYLFTCLTWCPIVGVELTKYPVISKYFNQIALRPAVKKAIQAEGLTLKVA